MLNYYNSLFLLMLLSLSSKFIRGFKKMSVDRSLSSLSAGKVKIEDILKNPQWPEKWPFQPR